MLYAGDSKKEIEDAKMSEEREKEIERERERERTKNLG